MAEVGKEVAGKEPAPAEFWETGKVAGGMGLVLANIWDLEGEDKGKELVLADISNTEEVGLGKELVLVLADMAEMGKEVADKEPAPAEFWETGTVAGGMGLVLANIWDLEGEDKGKELVLAEGQGQGYFEHGGAGSC
eukprot:TRINITY_DN1599_c2_g1_i14.p5 TRINITY_DN1599_c2_g1~~TRINITY_DN1599_c2_g1_i14.p5  ORF type:complete len:150 (-),score=47.34 TRINITY_DN1599_c2_g1_i14:150-560(-)